MLLIACANVNLQLARAASRRHETALRGALGARRLRLLRQFLVESLMLATRASAVGVVIALVVTWLVRQGEMPAGSAGISRLAELIRMPFGKLSAAVKVKRGAVLAFTAGLALVTTIFFGLAPAISGSRPDLRKSLQGTALRSSLGREQRLLRHMLLIMEVGLAVMLLSASGLLIRSFSNVLRNDSGFDPSHCLTGVVQRNYDEPAESVTRFVHQLLPRLLALPGAQAAAVGQTALSNYLLTTVLCQTLFLWGPWKLYGKLEYYQYTVVVFSVWVVNLIVSPLWLRAFEFGPVEWLWRSLTYWKLQPMRLRA